jgi:hypothetical protein
VIAKDPQGDVAGLQLRLAELDLERERGRYLAEGLDDARLDTLFLTMPISWRGTLAQYAGRLHRFHAAKREVIIYDYVTRMSRCLRRWPAGAGRVIPPWDIG